MSNPSERAFDVLAGTDPVFGQLIDLLYGPDVEFDEAWDDVFAKNNPGPSDLHINSAPAPGRRKREANRMEARVGLAGDVIGMTAGTAALGASLAHRGHLVRTAGKIKKLPGARKVWHVLDSPGLQAGSLATDVVGAKVLASQSKKGKPGTASKRAPYDAELIKLAQGQYLVNMAQVKAARAAGGISRTPGATTARGRSGGSQRKLASEKTSNAGSTSTGSAAPYAKGEQVEVTWHGEFSKFDQDKQQAFGWASVAEINGQPVVDKQGDYIHPDDLENAAYNYVLKSRVGGDMHYRTDGVNIYPDSMSKAGDRPVQAGNMIESMVFTPEKIKALGLPEDFPVAWWVGFHYPDPQMWNIVKNHRTGFSIHGTGVRLPVDIDQLMGQVRKAQGEYVVQNRTHPIREATKLAGGAALGAGLIRHARVGGQLEKLATSSNKTLGAIGRTGSKVRGKIMSTGAQKPLKAIGGGLKPTQQAAVGAGALALTGPFHTQTVQPYGQNGNY